MKKKLKSKPRWLGIALALICAAIALLDTFDLHPQFSVGRLHAYWSGVRHMDYISGTMTTPVSGHDTVVQRDFDIGPVRIAIEI